MYLRWPCSSRAFFIALWKYSGSWKAASKECNESTLWLPIFLDSLPISRCPCTVGYFSPLMKVLGTWNRVQRVQWKYPLIADFPRSLPISPYTLYSRVFFTPYESTRDVKPRPKSAMKVPFDCRFSSIVTDFSVSLYSRVFFTPYESTRNVKPRPKSAMKVPVRLPIFLDSLPISPYTLYSRVFFTPYESTLERETASKECNESTLWLPIFLVRCRFLRHPVQ